MEYRDKIRELLQTGLAQQQQQRGTSSSASTFVCPPEAVHSFRKRSVSQERSKRAAASAVVVAASLMDLSKQEEESGQPDDPGKSFDELHEWNVDVQGQYYRQKGPLTFEDFLQTGLLGSDQQSEPYGIQDPRLAKSSFLREPKPTCGCRSSSASLCL